MQNWKDLYIELADKINQIEAVRWIDLWHNQVNFLEEEHPFPTPAVFLSFRGRNFEDIGLKVGHSPVIGYETPNLYLYGVLIYDNIFISIDYECPDGQIIKSLLA